MAKTKTSEYTFITYFIICVCFVSVRILGLLGLLSFLGEVGSILLNSLMQIALFVIAVFMFSALQKQKPLTTFKFFGYKKISLKAVVISVAIGGLVYFLNIFIAGFFDGILVGIGYVPEVSSRVESYPIYLLFINLFITAVLPAICEETSHRGLLLKGGSAMGVATSLIISALLFGFLHMDIEKFFYATIIGLFVGYLSIVCDSIYPAMIVHFMNNALGVFYEFSRFYKLSFAQIMNTVINFMLGNGIIGYIFTALLITLICWLLLFLVKKLFLETTGRNVANLQAEMYKELARNDYLQDVESMRADINGESAKQSIHTNLEELYVEKNIKMGLMTELDKDLLSSGKFKHSATSLAFLIASFVLIGGVTIFDLVQGILRGFGIIC